VPVPCCWDEKIVAQLHTRVGDVCSETVLRCCNGMSDDGPVVLSGYEQQVTVLSEH
jgi:hypothetical protein